MQIAEGELDRPDVLALLAFHLETMREHSPPCRAHALPAEALAAPGITFFTVRDDDPDDGDGGETLLGCGALKEISGGTAGEIKSMRTAPEQLRRGVAAFLLQHLIAEAKRRGYEALYLETGSGELFEPAIALYTKFGFTPCGPFEGYEENGFSRFLTLTLS